MTRTNDAHAHRGSEAERRVRREQDIVTMVCAGTPAQAERLSEEAAENANILPAAGLHPWHCDKCSAEEMRPFLEQVPVIGEIGLDSFFPSRPSSGEHGAGRADQGPPAGGDGPPYGEKFPRIYKNIFTIKDASAILNGYELTPVRSLLKAPPAGDLVHGK